MDLVVYVPGSGPVVGSGRVGLGGGGGAATRLFYIATASGRSNAKGGVERALCNGGMLENRYSQPLAAHCRDFLFVTHRRRQLLGL